MSAKPLPPRGGPGSRRLLAPLFGARPLAGHLSWAAFLLGLLALATFHAWDHAAWLARDTQPLVDADSPLHMEIVARVWASWSARPSLGNLYHAGTYPPAFHAVAVLLFKVLEPSIHVLRLAGAVFTFLGTIGVGFLAARALGRPVGLAAAAALWTFPMVWVERAQAQLDLPLAGAVALAFAFLPTPRRPRTRWLAVAGGMGMNLALYTKQAMLPIAAAGLGWLGLRALLGWLRDHRRPGPARDHLVDVVITCAVVAVISGWHYHQAWEALSGAMNHIYTVGEPLEGATWVGAKLGLLAWFTHRFMQAPHFYGLLAGLACLPFLARRSPLLAPVLAGLLGGLTEFLHFPNPHERHFLALAPLVLVLALSPLGLLRGAWWRRGLQVLLSAAVVVYGVAFSWSWHAGSAPWGGQAMTRGGHEFGHFQELRRPSEALRWLTSRRSTFYTGALPPQQTDWPQVEIVGEVTAALGPPTAAAQAYRDLSRDPGAPVTLVLDGVPTDHSLGAYAHLLGEHRVRFLGITAGDLARWVGEARAAGEGPRDLLALVCEPPEAEGRLRARVEALGFRTRRTWQGSLVPGGAPLDITLLDTPGRDG